MSNNIKRIFNKIKTTPYYITIKDTTLNLNANSSGTYRISLDSIAKDNGITVQDVCFTHLQHTIEQSTNQGEWQYLHLYFLKENTINKFFNNLAKGKIIDCYNDKYMSEMEDEENITILLCMAGQNKDKLEEQAEIVLSKIMAEDEELIETIN